MVLHHTDCGAQTFRDDEFRLTSIKSLVLTCLIKTFFHSLMLKKSVREDMAILRQSPLIPDDVIISGAVYDVDTGRMTQVNP